MATVNANFKNGTGHFNGVYDFRVDSLYVFDGYAGNELSRPHPKYQYGLVADVSGFKTVCSMNSSTRFLGPGLRRGAACVAHFL